MSTPTDARTATGGGGRAGLIGTVLSGRYLLEAKLGSGGMSTVYLAQDQTLDRPVAVKVLHREISDEPEQLERFRREARSVAKLSHPNLVTVIDAGEDGGTPYIVFEYVEGETLKQRIQRVGPLGVDEAVAYAIEIGRGLAAAHARKLVHRDVKPQNVLIDQEGRAKVTDFGISRSLEAEGQTATGRVLGTTDYVSPEQAMGEDVDDRSDVYSLGVVLYEMLTGEVPFHAETQVGVAMRHVHEQMPDVQELRPEVSAALAGVIDRATDKDLDYRYATVPELLDDLEASLEVEAARSGGTTGEATAVLDSVPKPRRELAGPRRRSSWVGILAGVIGAGLIVAALVIGEKQLNGGTTAGAPVKIASAAEFDPGGDNRETGTQGLAIDGNPTSTAWQTEHYDTAQFGGLKKPGEVGVGLIVQVAGSPVAAKTIDVRSPEQGWDAQVYATADSSPPSDLSGWGSPVGQVTTGGTHQSISVNAKPSRAYLLWITKLPPAQDSPGRFQMEVSDIRILR